MGTPSRARENPFRSANVAGFRYRADAKRLAGWRSRLRSDAPYRLAIVGPEGTGKTTLLEDLAAGIGPRDWVKIRLDDSPREKTRALGRLLGRNPTPLFVDGLEALPRAICFFPPRFFRPRLLATLHRPRRGLGTWVETRFDPETLCLMVEFLTDRPLSPGERTLLEDYGSRTGGNLREVLRALYLSWRADAESPVTGLKEGEAFRR